jgi:hypothetical protein
MIVLKACSKMKLNYYLELVHVCASGGDLWQTARLKFKLADSLYSRAFASFCARAISSHTLPPPPRRTTMRNPIIYNQIHYSNCPNSSNLSSNRSSNLSRSTFNGIRASIAVQKCSERVLVIKAGTVLPSNLELKFGVPGPSVTRCIFGHVRHKNSNLVGPHHLYTLCTLSYHYYRLRFLLCAR